MDSINTSDIAIFSQQLSDIAYSVGYTLKTLELRNYTPSRFVLVSEANGEEIPFGFEIIGMTRFLYEPGKPDLEIRNATPLIVLATLLRHRLLLG